MALTASGSAVAAWSVWQAQGLSIAWTILAGSAAVLSIVHSSLGVPGRLKEWLEVKREFLQLAVDLESFRYHMKINPNFDVEKSQKDLDDYRKRYGELEGRIPSDFFATSRLKAACQENVNAQLSSSAQGDNSGNEGLTSEAGAETKPAA